MKRFIFVLLLFTLLLASPAQGDWRWAKPHFKQHRVVSSCDTLQCIKSAHIRTRSQKLRKITKYNHFRNRQWTHWTSLYIPDCTWYGESGVGPEYARYRYTMPNQSGSGALGKFQFMSGTYHSNAKFHDWSALDQEIAARREYWKHGTQPWSNC